MNYVLHIITMINIYIILALSLNLLVGYNGLISLCQAAFYGIGAYISTLVIMKTGIGFIPAILISLLGSALLSLLISIPSIRLKGDYFVLSSLGFQIIVFTILYNWVDITRGPYGIPGIPRPEIFGFTINSVAAYALFSGIFALICAFLIYLIGNSPFGRVLKAIREDEMATSALGKNVVKFKIVCFAISAAFASISGALFAGYMRYIDPTSFTLMESVFILSIVIIGGTGNIKGPILGAILLLVLPELLRFLNLPDSIAPNVRQIIYGLLIILIMRFRPQGILGEYQYE